MYAPAGAAVAAVGREWDDASLIVDLVVDGAEPAQVAAERGVSRPVLVEMLRDAVDERRLCTRTSPMRPWARASRSRCGRRWHARAARRASILARCAASRCLPDEEEPQP
jgi:hypothetical protein